MSSNTKKRPHPAYCYVLPGSSLRLQCNKNPLNWAENVKQKDLETIIALTISKVLIPTSLPHTPQELPSEDYLLSLSLGAWVLSHVQLFMTSWTGTHQTPLSMRLSRQEYWCGLPFPPPGDISDPGIKPSLLRLLDYRWTLIAEPPGKPSTIKVSRNKNQPLSGNH